MPHDQVTPDTESIWRSLSDRLRQFVRSRVASGADVDDILQTVFLRIHRNLGTLRESDRLESWVFQIARHAIIDHRRQRSHDVLEAEPASAPFPEPVAENINAEVAGCLGEMIKQLPEHLQRAVALYERDGVSQKEIASREAITLSGAKSRVQRGRTLLKELLEQCCQLQLDRYGNVLAWDAPAGCTSATEHCKCRTP